MNAADTSIKSTNQEYDYLLKIIFLGPANVGKTAIIVRLCDEEFSESYSSTVGIDFKVKTLEYNSKKFKMQLWDTAGQERYHSLTTGHFRGAHGCLAVFDLTDQKSFEKCKVDLEKYYSNMNELYENHSLLLVGNKNDLTFLRKVPYEEAKAYADSMKAEYMETSAKTGDNVTELFTLLLSNIVTHWAPMLQQQQLAAMNQASGDQEQTSFIIGKTTKISSKKGGCKC